MRNPFSFSRAQQPFLSPLGRQRRLPAIAVPALLMLFGGVALVVTFGTALFGLQPSGIAAGPAAGPEVAEARIETPQPRTVTVEREMPAEEEPALVTALPQSPITETGEVVLEPVPAQEAAGDDTARVSDSDQAPTAAIPLPAEITAFAPQPRPATPPANPAASPAATPAGNASMRAAVVRRAVNMRAAPNGGAQVLGVVPGSSEISAETNCGWCRIDYQGRSGFIYKSFIDYR